MPSSPVLPPAPVWSNYDIAYVDGGFTVNLKTLTITADDQSKTYGDAFTFLGTEFTPDGLVDWIPSPA